MAENFTQFLKCGKVIAVCSNIKYKMKKLTPFMTIMNNRDTCNKSY